MFLRFKIPLKRPDVGERELAAVTRVFQSAYLNEGYVTAELEEKVAKYVGARYAVATTSCTITLELELRGLGIKHLRVGFRPK